MKRGMEIPVRAKDAGNRIPAVEKTVRILHYLAKEGRGTPTKAIAAEVEVSASTCYRILKTLEVAGWIAQDEWGGFHIGKGLLPVVEPLADLREVIRRSRPVLEAGARRWGVTVKLCSRQGSEQITVAVGTPSNPVGILAPEGVPYPVVEAASGAALLAGLTESELEDLIHRTPEEHWRRHRPEELRDRVDQCQKRGWCENIGKHPQGIDAIACPVRIGDHRLALCMIGLRGDFREEVLSDLREGLLEMARELEE